MPVEKFVLILYDLEFIEGEERKSRICHSREATAELYAGKSGVLKE